MGQANKNLHHYEYRIPLSGKYELYNRLYFLNISLEAYRNHNGLMISNRNVFQHENNLYAFIPTVK